MKITSAANPKLKEAIRLRDHRTRTSPLLIDGVRETLYAIRCGVVVDHWFVGEERNESDHDTTLELTAAIGREPLELTAELFSKLAYGDRRSGVVAVAQRPTRTLAQLSLPQQPLILIAEGLEKPGNVGAIARTSDAVGADAFVLVDSAVDPFSSNAIRASMGTILSPQIALASAGEVQSWVREQGVRIVAAWVDAPKLYCDCDLTGPLAIVLGSEAYGLSDHWRSTTFEPVSLPMSGVADSLNVSTTAAVLAYEAWRQRRK